MLGLPSTTEVGKRIPKEAFYRNLKLNTHTRDEFVHLVEHIIIANSIKPATANVADGKYTHEIMVLGIHLKSNEQPVRAIEAIANNNPHKLVFHTEPDSVTYILRKRLYSTESLETLIIAGNTLDSTWDSFCSQVVFGDVDGTDIDARLELALQKTKLEKEIAKLDAACRKAKQINRKNELFAQLKTKQQKLKELER